MARRSLGPFVLSVAIVLWGTGVSAGAGSGGARPLPCDVAPTPDAGTAVNKLVAVSATSQDDVWAVGNFYASYGWGVLSQTLIEHWDGTAWSIVSSQDVARAGSFLRGVAALSRTDAWAVGYYELAGGEHTLTEHWDGTAWSIVASPDPSWGNNVLSGVSGNFSNDVWAVGGSSNTQGTVSRTLTEHWDGTAWVVVSNRNGSHTTAGFLGVAALSSKDVWAVGLVGTQFYYTATLTARWNGRTWRFIDSPSPGPTINILYAVSGVAQNDVWAVGYSWDQHAVAHTLALHWDGTGWTLVHSANWGTAGSFLSGVAAVTSTDVWAVGSYTTTPYAASHTLVEHWDGAAWHRMPSPDPDTSELMAVAASSSHDMWAVGDSYAIAGNTYSTLAVHLCGH